MVLRVPDEYFRRHPEPQSQEDNPEDGVDEASVVSPALARDKPRLLPIYTAAVLVLLMLVVGYVVGGLLLSLPERLSAPAPSRSSEVPSLPRPSPEPGIAVYDGPTRVVILRRISSTCEEADSTALFDHNTTTIWRCPGSGVGQVLRFDFGQTQEIVGIRLASGSLNDRAETQVLRQILAVRWRFSDGSWFEQSMPGRPSSVQEVQFPTLSVQGAELEILATTDPATARGGEDAVSIGQVEFLARA